MLSLSDNNFWKIISDEEKICFLLKYFYFFVYGDFFFSLLIFGVYRCVFLIWMIKKNIIWCFKCEGFYCDFLFKKKISKYLLIVV